MIEVIAVIGIVGLAFLFMIALREIINAIVDRLL
jgi:hypothetical protein